MRAAALLLLTLAACSGAQTGTTSVPGRGAVGVEVIPNPIVVRQISGSNYEFPFDVIVRETGGRPITVTRVTATVYAGAGFSVGRESWDADQIRSLGFSTNIGANAEVRYHFAPRKTVPDDRVLANLSAELKVEAVDDAGATTTASTQVTIRKG